MASPLYKLPCLFLERDSGDPDAALVMMHFMLVTPGQGPPAAVQYVRTEQIQRDRCVAVYAAQIYTALGRRDATLAFLSAALQEPITPEESAALGPSPYWMRACMYINIAGKGVSMEGSKLPDAEMVRSGREDLMVYLSRATLGSTDLRAAYQRLAQVELFEGKRPGQRGIRGVAIARAREWLKKDDAAEESLLQVMRVRDGLTNGGVRSFVRSYLSLGNGTSLCEAGTCNKRAKKACGRCGTLYCSEDCQKLHWAEHKSECKGLAAGTDAIASMPMPPWSRMGASQGGQGTQASATAAGAGSAGSSSAAASAAQPTPIEGSD